MAFSATDFPALTLSQYLKATFPNPEAFVKLPDGGSLIPKQSVVFYFGEPGCGKSLLAERLVVELGAGISHLDRFEIAKPVRTLYLQNELPPADLQTRFLTIHKHLGSPKMLAEPTIRNVRGWEINSMGGVRLLDSFIAETKPEVVFIDSLYYAVNGDVSEGRVANTVIRIFNRMLSKYSDLGISFVFIHHSRKQGQSDDRVDRGQDEMLGSRQWSAWTSTQVRLTAFGENEVTMEVTKLRHGRKPGQITLTIPEDGPYIIGQNEVPLSKVCSAKTAVLELLGKQTAPIDSNTIYEQLHKAFARPTILRILKSLKEDKRIKTLPSEIDIRQQLYVVAAS